MVFPGTVGVGSAALVLVAIRLLPQRIRPASAWSELGCVVLSACLMVGLGGVWLATFPLTDSVAHTTSDFSEYCRSVTALLEDSPRAFSQNRSFLAALPAAAAARHLGVADGLLVGAWVGQGLLGAGLYTWGRSLHSPVAGLASVLVACTLVPLTALGRTLTFYPMIVGSLVLATGLVAAHWRSPRPSTALAAGIGVALALLVDLRGLLWALPLLGLAIVRVLACGRRAGGALQLAILAGTVAIAWRLGTVVYPAHATTLEVLSDLTKGWQGVVWVPHVRPPELSSGGYTWGRSDPLGIPGTLQWLAAQGARVPASLRTHPQTLQNYGQLLAPLKTWFLGAMVVTLAGLLRHPGRLLLLIGSALPFAAALEGAVAARFAGLRFLGNGAPLLAVLGGVAVGVLVLGARRGPRGGVPAPGLRAALAMVFLALLGLGTLPSDLSPLAHWRGRYKNADAGLTTACPGPTGVPTEPTLLYRLP